MSSTSKALAYNCNSKATEELVADSRFHSPTSSNKSPDAFQAISVFLEISQGITVLSHNSTITSAAERHV